MKKVISTIVVIYLMTNLWDRAYIRTFSNLASWSFFLVGVDHWCESRLQIMMMMIFYNNLLLMMMTMTMIMILMVDHWRESRLQTMMRAIVKMILMMIMLSMTMKTTMMMMMLLMTMLTIGVNPDCRLWWGENYFDNNFVSMKMAMMMMSMIMTMTMIVWELSILWY